MLGRCWSLFLHCIPALAVRAPMTCSGVFVVEATWIEKSFFVVFLPVEIPKPVIKSYHFTNVKPTWGICNQQHTSDFIVCVDLWYAHCLLDDVLYIQLSSIPGLEDVKFEVSSANMNSVTNGPVAQATTDQQTAVSPQAGVSNKS